VAGVCGGGEGLLVTGGGDGALAEAGVVMAGGVGLVELVVAGAVVVGVEIGGSPRWAQGCHSSPPAMRSIKTAVESRPRGGERRHVAPGAGAADGTGACWVGAVGENAMPLLVDTSASAWANSRQRGNRCSGVLASARANAASKGANSVRIDEGAGAGSVRCWLITATWLEWENIGVPVRRWYAVAAKAYWSARPSIALPMSCSGAA
jgi:hypothetical protein